MPEPKRAPPPGPKALAGTPLFRRYVILLVGDALGQHGGGHLQEARAVGAHHQVALLADLLGSVVAGVEDALKGPAQALAVRDRKSTRLNSSHVSISYAVFCLKKKKQQNTT